MGIRPGFQREGRPKMGPIEINMRRLRDMTVG
jgi:hypothetical protein